MARLVLAAAVGIAVGVYTWNPYYGLQAFSLVYGVTGFLDPNKKVSGPRLNDLRAPAASYGSPIPYLEGAPRLAGVFFWASEKREIARTETIGKGGPGVDSTTYTYEIDCLIGLAINECQSLSRVWSNGRLIWSNRADADGETIGVSADIPDWRDIRFYSGDENQTPDPTYEAAVGVGNAPAYRGRTTVFIEGLNLGGTGQLPILTFEVLSESQPDAISDTFASITQDYGVIGQGASPFSPAGFLVHLGQWDNNYLNTHVIVYQVDGAGNFAILSEYDADSNSPSGHGQTDVAGIMGAYGNISGAGDPYTIYWSEISNDTLAPIRYSFVFPGTEPFNAGGVLGGAQVRFCIRGDDVFFASTNFGSGKIYRYSKADGLVGFAIPLATSTPTTYKDALATDGTLLYALEYFATDIEVFDVATLTLQYTITGPAATSGQDCSIVVNEDGTLFFLNGSNGNAYRWDGAAWQNEYPLVVPGTVSREAQYGVFGDILYLMAAPNYPFTGPQEIIAFYRTVALAVVTLDQVVRRLCLRTGQLLDADIDVTQLASTEVRAMAITQVSPVRQTLDMLAGAYLFEFVENAKLKAVLRGGPPALTIPFRDLGASADASGADPLPKKRMNEMEVPARVSIKFANVLNDFQDGLESGDRLTTESYGQSVVEVPLGFTPAEAKKLADVQTMDLATSLIAIGPISITQNYARLEPTDVLLIEDEDGSIFRVRIVKGSVSSGIYTFELILDDATVINSVVGTDASYTSSTLLRALAPTQLVLMDIPILRDVDNMPGGYVAFDATGRWPGAALVRAIDNITYSWLLSTNTKATIGFTSTALGDFTDGNVFDETNSLTVNVGDHTLSSTTRDAILTGTTNAMLVGSEIVQFRDAALQSPGVYILTGFLRGRRGTEWAMDSHAAIERVVLLESATLRHLTDDVADIDQPYYYKAVTFGKSGASATTHLFTDTGVAMKPFAPVDLRVDRTGADLAVTWHRRSRLSSRFLATVDPVLGEASESYDVEVHNGVTLIDSATVTSPSYTDPALTAGYTVTVRQNSAIVGPGYPATIEL